jgi:hypothetical protein
MSPTLLGCKQILLGCISDFVGRVPDFVGCEQILSRSVPDFVGSGPRSKAAWHAGMLGGSRHFSANPSADLLPSVGSQAHVGQLLGGHADSFVGRPATWVALSRWCLPRAAATKSEVAPVGRSGALSPWLRPAPDKNVGSGLSGGFVGRLPDPFLSGRWQVGIGGKKVLAPCA